MTCIVGLEVEGAVILAGDIQGTGWNSKVVHTQPKVFNKNGVLFGYTTSYRFGQLLEHNLTDPVVPAGEEYRWLVTVLVPEAKKVLVASDWKDGGNALIGVNGQLWELQTDFSVLRSTRGYAAVGSGTEYALGSLMTALDLGKPIARMKEAKAALRNAIKVAGTFCPSVGTEATVISA